MKKLKKQIALVLAFTLAMTSSVFASSRNWVNKTRTIKVDQSMTDEYLKIIPYDTVETGSSIIVTVTNAKVLSQAEIDGTVASYRENGYQYQKTSWDGKGFWDVMPYIKTNELPYRIYRTGSHTFEVRLINVPDRYTDSSLYTVNGSSGTACYNIPLPIVGDTGGDILLSIDNNDSSISSCTLNVGYVYEKSVYLKEKKGTGSSSSSAASDAVNVEDVTEETTAAEETETTTEAAKSSSADSDTDENDADEKVVDISDNELISVRGVSKLLMQDDEYSTLRWDGDTKTVTIVYKGKVVSFTAGARYVEIDGEMTELDEDQTAEIVNDRMYVPLGVLCDSLGITLKTSFFAPMELETEESTEETTETADEDTEETTETDEDEAEDTEESTDEDETEETTVDSDLLITPDDIILRSTETTTETTTAEED